jgi:hypothetical protein
VSFGSRRFGRARRLSRSRRLGAFRHIAIGIVVPVGLRVMLGVGAVGLRATVGIDAMLRASGTMIVVPWLGATGMYIPMVRSRRYARPFPMFRPRDRTRMRWRSGGPPVMNLPMFPLRPLPVPGSAVVVTTPIHIERERHDRYTQARRVRIQGHITALVSISDVGCIHPTAGIRGHHVTPAPIIETAHDLDG